MASKTESLAMCKTGHEHAANKETHKPRVHTKHDKHESTQPVKNTSSMPHRKIPNKRKQNECTRTEKCTARANSRPHAPTARPNLERECPNPNTKPELGLKQDKSAGIRTPCSNMKQSTLEPGTHQKTRQERVSWLCHKTMNKLDRSDSTLTL